MNEKFIYFLWKYQLFDKQALIDQNEQKIQVFNPGVENTNSGPDFFNAKIKIGETIWAGNVEIHLKSSDWYLHHHHNDPNYQNTILHVCWQYDKAIFYNDSTEIPTLELKPIVSHKILKEYQFLITNDQKIPCSSYLENIKTITLESWFQRLVAERFEEKSEFILKQFKSQNNASNHTFYITIAKCFGLKINEQPFEMLALALPQLILSKHHTSLFQIEALIFGTAGFLNENINDDYFQKLKSEFLFLKSKYNIVPLEKHIWKFFRLMPANFPTIRLAQFAMFIYQSQNLFSKILDAETLPEILSHFKISVSEYWLTHYQFGEITKAKPKNVGNSMINTMLINGILPFLFFYHQHLGNDAKKEKIMNWLENIPYEQNTISKTWKQYGVPSQNAGHSQAQIQLFTKYCKQKQCLNCMIAYQILNPK